MPKVFGPLLNNLMNENTKIKQHLLETQKLKLFFQPKPFVLNLGLLKQINFFKTRLTELEN